VRLRDLTHRFEGDPLLKVGVGAMILAVAFAIVVAFAGSLDRPLEPAAAKQEAKSTAEPLVRKDPGVEPWVEKDIPPPSSEASPVPASASASASGSRPEAMSGSNGPRGSGSGLPAGLGSGNGGSDPGVSGYADSDSGGSSGYGSSQDRSGQTLPLRQNEYPLPTEEQRRATNQPRHYNLPPGAIMSLTINPLGLNNVPVMNSDSTRALDQGVIHVPETSFPWSDTPERNVYLAGHRLGWPGMGSHLVFYQLDELSRGDRVILRDREGRSYRYRVIESFIVGPSDSWVMGRVRGRDLLTLQTCTPIPSFHERLIVRAERV
jgi:sortase A